MFEIKYKIVIDDEEGENEISGEYGYFVIECNNESYGEYYDSKINPYFFASPLYAWFERILLAAFELMFQNYIAVNDVESDYCIEFKKKKDTLVVSVVQADFPQGSTGVEAKLHNISEVSDEKSWKNQEILMKDFIKEVLQKAKLYYKEICMLNQANLNAEQITYFKGLIERLEKSNV